MESDFIQNVLSTKPILKKSLPLSDIEIRIISSSDLEKGFIELLSQLTKAPRMNKTKFEEILNRKRLNTIFIVCEHLPSKRIIGTASLNIEEKFIRGGAKVGHLEEVVVDKEFRNKGIGGSMIKKLKEIAKEEGCYKII